jgi:hypothetical protein
MRTRFAAGFAIRKMSPAGTYVTPTPRVPSGLSGGGGKYAVSSPKMTLGPMPGPIPPKNWFETSNPCA